MGAWGGGLYQNDTALDVKAMAKAVAKLPFEPDRLLAILLEAQPFARDADDPEACLFWYAAADALHPLGAAAPELIQKAQALMAAEPGAYALGFGPRERRRWLADIARLRDRLAAPRATRIVKPAAAPDALFGFGDVLTFPTERGEAFNVWLGRGGLAGFKPDGWGCLLVTGVERAFGWTPVTFFAPLGTDPRVPADLDAARAARLLFPLRGLPRIATSRHMRLMGAVRIGRLPLDPARIAALPAAPETAQDAAIIGWSMASGAINADRAAYRIAEMAAYLSEDDGRAGLQPGAAVSDLLQA